MGSVGASLEPPYRTLMMRGLLVTQVWMEELHLPALLPSMCDDLMIRIQDSDLGFFLDSDDILGTSEVSLGAISHSSGSGSGFLPCFGPAFINFYGATREFEMLPGHHAEDLNEGVGEGVAYRGRILCELVSQPGGDKTEIKKGMVALAFNLLPLRGARRPVDPWRQGRVATILATNRRKF